MDSTGSPVFLDAADMAARLGVSTRWLAAETLAGRIPSFRAGSRVLYEPAMAAEAIRERILAERAQRQEVPRATS